MGLNLYYGGCGKHNEYVVAENLEDAKTKIGIKLNASYLPIEANLIDNIDGFKIVPTTEQSEVRHCKKCDFSCESQGELLKHYREEHPKGA